MTVYCINLIPAYGRDYKTETEVLQDWNDGKDFQIADIGSGFDGKYTSNRDWRGKAVRIRFDRWEYFTIIKDDHIAGRDE